MKNLSDDMLISLFQEGHNEAFDELLLRYKDKLYNYIFMIVQNREVTEDVFQDTFTRVIIQIKSKRYNEKGRFQGFLFRLAHNLVVDIYRQEQTAQFISPTEAGYDIFNDKDLCDQSLEDRVSYNQVLRDIRRLILFLPENQQEIIRMRFYEDMSFKDIAEALNISINTALGRVRYAIINMRNMAAEHNISLAV